MADINLHPQGSPYGRDQYGTTLYGQQALEDRELIVHASYSVIGSMKRVVHSKYRVKSRYTGKEDTIEDIYCYATRRYMALGCLDGPLFPFYTKQDGVESDV